MQNIIANVSYDTLNTKVSIKIKGTDYRILHEYQLLINKRGNLLKYGKNGNITEKSVFTNTLGYEYVVINHKCYFVHRLVALAYNLIDKYEYNSDNEVDHINDIRDDNRLCNLQVLTKAENLAKRKKTNNKAYVLYNEAQEMKFDSKTEAAQWLIDMGYSKATLQHTKENLARKREKHYGFEFEEVK